VLVLIVKDSMVVLDYSVTVLSSRQATTAPL
jgi:hypothetical protein